MVAVQCSEHPKPRASELLALPCQQAGGRPSTADPSWPQGHPLPWGAWCWAAGWLGYAPTRGAWSSYRCVNALRLPFWRRHGLLEAVGQCGEAATFCSGQCYNVTLWGLKAAFGFGKLLRLLLKWLCVACFCLELLVRSGALSGFAGIMSCHCTCPGKGYITNFCAEVNFK